ncbi:hypothetical protein [Ornithinimicrobium kibberense]|uniref:hypothetical protein n=1 Tax=Ornithinimicrobium kibberense TaxID=282060 RepID=UPI0036169F8A
MPSGRPPSRPPSSWDGWRPVRRPDLHPGAPAAHDEHAPSGHADVPGGQVYGQRCAVTRPRRLEHQAGPVAAHEGHRPAEG